MRPTPEDRFFRRIWFKPGCWTWLGALNNDGYGHIWRAPGNVLAHRFSYEWYVGPIPEGLEIDHLCRNRACVNPDHLEPVTHAENVQRGDGPWAVNARRTHCLHGHEFTPENTKFDKKGYRQCRECARKSALKWAQRNRETAKA